MGIVCHHPVFDRILHQGRSHFIHLFSILTGYESILEKHIFIPAVCANGVLVSFYVFFIADDSCCLETELHHTATGAYAVVVGRD